MSCLKAYFKLNRRRMCFEYECDFFIKGLVFNGSHSQNNHIRNCFVSTCIWTTFIESFVFWNRINFLLLDNLNAFSRALDVPQKRYRHLNKKLNCKFFAAIPSICTVLLHNILTRSISNINIFVLHKHI